jgi:hypothetical protein
MGTGKGLYSLKAKSAPRSRRISRDGALGDQPGAVARMHSTNHSSLERVSTLVMDTCGRQWIKGGYGSKIGIVIANC